MSWNLPCSLETQLFSCRNIFSREWLVEISFQYTKHPKKIHTKSEIHLSQSIDDIAVLLEFTKSKSPTLWLHRIRVSHFLGDPQYPECTSHSRLEQRSANFFCKGLDNKYFRLWRHPASVSTLLVVRKQS